MIQKVLLITVAALCGHTAILNSQGLSHPRTAQEIATAEARCRQTAGQLLTSTDPAVARRQMNISLTCPDTSAALLAARWRNPPTDSLTMDALVGVSRRMIDARIVDASLAQLMNRALPLATRVKALEGVLGQLELWITFGELRKGYTIEPGVVVLDVVGWSARPRATYDVAHGSAPVTPQVRARVIEALRQLEQGPDNQYLMLAAKGARGFVGRTR